jgi:cysteine synthase
MSTATPLPRQVTRAAAVLPDAHNYYLHRLAPTPLCPVQLRKDSRVIWCKLEFLNPSGSTKDRIAQHILTKAWREGKLHPGDTVVEASSGSTSIAMALASAQLGLRFVAVMPEGVSSERVLMIRAYGGEIRLTPASEGMAGALAETERMAAEQPVFLPRQFANIENAQAHRFGTAREILEQIPGGAADAVVSGVGTGGTLVGLYQGFCDLGCPVTPVHARPVNLWRECDMECCSFSNRIPGVIDCLSSIFEPQDMPDLITVEVPEDEALETTRELVRLGFPVGPSSGLNYCAALRAFDLLERPEAHVVTVFPDRMERYFTTGLFEPYRS